MSSEKKHVSQMEGREKRFLLNRLQAVKHWKASKYMLDRMAERGGAMEKVLDVIRNGNLIEYHVRNGKSRILMRGTRIYDGDVFCVVFELTTKKLITMYFNCADDNHSTLKEEAYDESIDVIRRYKRETSIYSFNNRR